MSAPAAQFLVSAADSLRFAQLSGDWNPLHVDATAARRTPFGGTVVHGIHLLLLTLQRVLDHPARGARSLRQLSVSFSNPVRNGDTVQLGVTPGDGGSLRIAGRSAARAAFTVAVTVGDLAPDARAALNPDTPPATRPQALEFPPGVTAGATTLALDPALLADLFPRLAQSLSPGWIADLLATTRIVGMICPGLDSVYSQCRLAAREHASGAPQSRMDWRVTHSDERFRMIRMEVAGSVSQGQIAALFRAPAVEQLPLTEVRRHVAPNAFAGQRALVAGGSRGLGELAAKILAAGGAEVTITWSRGQADAQRVCAEAAALGLSCGARQLDLASVSEAGDLPGWLAALRPTHVYYFASPPIAKNTSGQFDAQLHARFEAIYVGAFAALVQALTLRRASAPYFFYPSSVFLDNTEPGFEEYCAAKLAGERLCHELAAQGIACVAPRLPRMRTDQTSGLRADQVSDSLPVMLAALGARRP
ncbi:MAG: SDR family NAD(P)-dependent oxidoreductase [Proteobacteria bacterium]|nr:SDR family NAD(P)-dependent oxidoreductase [Pseudomonadota bacterium]